MNFNELLHLPMPSVAFVCIRLMVHIFRCICASDTFLSSNLAQYNQPFSKNQNLALEQAFTIHPYLNKSSIIHLVKETLLNTKQERNGFAAKK